MPEKPLHLRRDRKDWKGKEYKPAILSSLIVLKKSIKEFPNNISQWCFISWFTKSLYKDKAVMLVPVNAFMLKGENSKRAQFSVCCD